MKTKIYFLLNEFFHVRYVGKTKRTLELRLKGHLDEAQKGHKCKKCCGIRKMFRKGKCPTIVLQTEVEGTGSNAERAYIKWYRSKGVDLWNLTNGGDGNSDPSIETRKKIGDALRNIMKSSEHRKKISKTLEGRKKNPETIVKLHLAAIGKPKPPFSPEHKKALRLAWTPERKKALGFAMKILKWTPERKKAKSLAMIGNKNAIKHQNERKVK
ncbi:MAG: GIY-YIG nuclease family protein [Candidatus Omnitrophota bacterium]